MKESREIIQRPAIEPTDIERPFEYTAAPIAVGRYPVYREANAQEGFQLADYWRAIRKRLWLVIGIAVLVTTLAAIYMARKPNVFEAKAIIQVDLEQANPDLMSTERASRIMPANSDSSYFNTQLQLLTSESLLRRVIKEHSYDSNKDFQQLKIENSTSAWRAMLKTIGLATDDVKPQEKVVSEVSPTSPSSLASTDDVAEAVRLAPYVEVVRKNLIVDPIRESRATLKDTRLIEVSWRHTDPALAAAVVNSIGETFTKQNQEKRSGTSRKTNDFLQERIASLQAEIQNDEVKYVADTEKYGILKADDEQTIVLGRLSGLNKSLLDAENERKKAESIYFAVVKSPELAAEMAEKEMGRYFTEIRTDIRAIEGETAKKKQELYRKKEELLAEYKENSDEVKDIDRQIKSQDDAVKDYIAKTERDLGTYRERAKTTIRETLRADYEKAKGQEDKIRADFNKQYTEAQGQNVDAVSLKLLEQKIATNKGFLENLQKQVSGNDIVNEGTENNISVAEIAIPNDVAVSPRRLTTVLAAFFLSTLFAMGLALFLEYLDDTIRTADEIENFLQLPALAAIPTIDSVPNKRKLLLVGGAAGEEGEEESNPNAELLIHTDSRSSLAEAYRQLRTSILLSTAGHAPKSLLITSSLPSEGKTTTATNTAISLAQTGAKVLIIDADMRRPRLHQVFNITNGAGLSTMLSSEVDEKEILEIVQYDDKSKLHLLPSGPVPPNPAELIGSEQMAGLLKKLQNHFTHVVIDSPPIASFTDGVLIASMVDGVILVVHAGKSSRQVVKRSKQLLNDIGAKVLGVVLNNVNLRSQDNYYYYQTYYHRSTYNSPDRD